MAESVYTLLRSSSDTDSSSSDDEGAAVGGYGSFGSSSFLAVLSQPAPSAPIPHLSRSVSSSSSSEPTVSISPNDIERIKLLLTELYGRLTVLEESGGEVSVTQRSSLAELEMVLSSSDWSNIGVANVEHMKCKLRSLLGVTNAEDRIEVLEDWAESQDPGAIHGTPPVDSNSRCPCLLRTYRSFRYNRRPACRYLRELLFVMGAGCVYDWVTFSCFKACADYGYDCLSVSRRFCLVLKRCIDDLSS